MANGPGRPIGSLADPEKSHRLDLIAWIQVNKNIRNMIERQLELFSKQIDRVEKNTASLDVDEQLAIMSGLTALLSTSVKTVDSGLKVNPSGKEPVDNPEDLMQELEGGKGA